MYERRQSIPVLYVRGTHYDVGYDVVSDIYQIKFKCINQCEWQIFEQFIIVST